ncbi:MAG: hypothetical protein QM784_11800 [Polyangiaceae bacterium]
MASRAINSATWSGRFFAGKSLAVYLGATTLVLAPTEDFLRSPEAHRNESWDALLRQICRIRAPRVLICLSQTPIDVGALDEITVGRAPCERMSKGSRLSVTRPSRRASCARRRHELPPSRSRWGLRMSSSACYGFSWDYTKASPRPNGLLLGT